MRRWMTALFCISLSLDPFSTTSSVRAEPTAFSSLERVVVLKDGSVYRGELLELVVNKYLVLKLRDGREQTFRWERIASQVPLGRHGSLEPREGSSLTPATPTSAQATPDGDADLGHGQHPSETMAVVTKGPQAAGGVAFPKLPRTVAKVPRLQVEDEVAGGRDADRSNDGAYAASPRHVLPAELRPYRDQFVRVSMRSPNPSIRLEYLDENVESDSGLPALAGTSFSTWRQMCNYPCGELIYRNSALRVTGPNIVTSSRFALPRDGKELELRVKPGHPAALGMGITLGIVGGLGVLVGGITLALFDIQLQDPHHGPIDDWFIGGLATTLIGGAVMATGIGLSVLGHTRVSAALARAVRDDEPD